MDPVYLALMAALLVPLLGLFKLCSALRDPGEGA